MNCVSQYRNSIRAAWPPRKIIVQQEKLAQVWKTLTAAEVQFNVTADFFESPKVREPLWCDYMASYGVTLSSLNFLCLLFKLFFWVIHNFVIIWTDLIFQSWENTIQSALLWHL